MGFWTFIAGGLGAVHAKNRLNPPNVVIDNPEYVVKKMTPKFSGWELRIGKRTDPGSGVQHRVSRSTRKIISGGRFTATIHWP